MNSSGITLLRAVTDRKEAVLPDSIRGIPVTELGPYALAARDYPVDGQHLEILCGTATGAADNSRLEELILPASLQRTGKYAFMDCRRLHSLRFSETLSEFGPGSFMNCRELKTLTVDGVPGHVCPALAELLKSSTGVFDVLFRSAEGDAEFVFPEYLEMITENEPTHFFNYTIEGGGLPYHKVFEQSRLVPARFDSLWNAFIAGGRGEETAIRLALGRVLFPFQLTENAKNQYLAYLGDHFPEAARHLIRQHSSRGLRFLLEHCSPSSQILDEVLLFSRGSGKTELTAMLLEERHRRFPAPSVKRYTL